MQLLLFIAIIPVIVLCAYIYLKDEDKEPRNLLKKTFVHGMLAVVPILILELAIGTFLSTDDNSNLIILFISTFLSVALVEEFFKWRVIYKQVYNKKEFNHAYDAIVYSVFSSLGFALVENVLYVINGGLNTGIIRALITVPSHACDAIIMGLYLGKAKQAQCNNNQKLSNRYMALSIIIPVITHAIYDYLIFAQEDSFLALFAIFMIVLLVICFKIVKKTANIKFNFDGRKVEKHDGNNYESIEVLRMSNSLESYEYAISRVLMISVILVICGICYLYL